MSNSVHPLRNANRLKLGAFALNGDTNRRTIHPHHYQFNWENSLDVAVQADEAGLEVVVPFARWRSIAGQNHFGGDVFEATTWASAVASRTSRCGLMSTIHVTTMHPVLAAKMMATVDRVSGGRFALNIVCGWFEAEMQMFGQDLLPHDQRYVYADEWISAIKRLWTEQEPFDFDGRFIHIKQGISSPKPIQQPHPPLMNAGGSPDGRAFVAKHCDLAFIPGHTYDDMRRDAAAYREQVRAAVGREIQIWTPCAVIQGRTMAEAEAMAEAYVAAADMEQLETAFRPGSPYAGNLSDPPEVIAARKRKFTLSGGSFLLVGDPDYIAAEMARASDAGVDGLLLTWVEPQSGIRDFTHEVLPRLEARGLRTPVAAETASRIAEQVA